MTILVGYTASKESKAALEEAIRIARSTHEGLLVVNAGPGGEHKHDSMVTEDQQLELQTLLDSTGLSAEFRQYARGRSTVDEIKDVADEVQPSVVVIGLKRRGTFGRFVMGSVSDGLLKELDQPVLCVKENPAKPSGVVRDAPSQDIAAAPEPRALAEAPDITDAPDGTATARTDTGPRR
ncbi:universal stress protein [Citricoccus sp. K5]|uniref:universal stress protein n=1 Tax=Citricoccus sp. K5 TaxID=2653135 RepID=UPI0012F391CA|nr:universal stress protein [Citricoccus sp. K5]VXB81949.1 Nucleotide-binding universal stress UspA family protein [Citricoccus sp. K5]